jgi:hypothetical protein
MKFKVGYITYEIKGSRPKRFHSPENSFKYYAYRNGQWVKNTTGETVKESFDLLAEIEGWTFDTKEILKCQLFPQS